MSRHYSRKVDSTHAAIRDELRRVGVSWIDTHRHGKGAPDGIAGAYGRSVLVEVKSPKGREKAAQAAARCDWRGMPWIVATRAEDVLAALDVYVFDVRK